MSVAQQNEPKAQSAPEDISGFQRIYFDTSVWNHIADAHDRDSLIRFLKRRRQIPLASVISVAEILVTPDLSKRDSLCETVRALHGEQQVLEQPLHIAKAAAGAFLRAERTLCIEETESARSFYAALSDPRNAPVEQVKQWKDNMDSRLQRFIEDIKPPLKDNMTNYLSPEVLEREDFLAVLCKFPTAEQLGLSIDQMRGLCHASDLWRALGATLAYTIQLSTTHAPKRRKKNGQRMKRPGGADIWQTVYLGCVEVFVSGDQWMLEAAAQISHLLKWPRCTLHTREFIDGLRKSSSPGGLTGTRICHVCGIPRYPVRGRHAIAAGKP